MKGEKSIKLNVLEDTLVDEFPGSVMIQKSGTHPIILKQVLPLLDYLHQTVGNALGFSEVLCVKDTMVDRFSQDVYKGDERIGELSMYVGRDSHDDIRAIQYEGTLPYYREGQISGLVAGPYPLSSGSSYISFAKREPGKNTASAPLHRHDRHGLIPFTNHDVAPAPIDFLTSEGVCGPLMTPYFPQSADEFWIRYKTRRTLASLASKIAANEEDRHGKRDKAAGY